MVSEGTNYNGRCVLGNPRQAEEQLQEPYICDGVGCANRGKRYKTMHLVFLQKTDVVDPCAKHLCLEYWKMQEASGTGMPEDFLAAWRNPAHG